LAADQRVVVQPAGERVGAIATAQDVRRAVADDLVAQRVARAVDGRVTLPSLTVNVGAVFTFVVSTIPSFRHYFLIFRQSPV
jgi:hypothetical protein